jgi:hypothetical protein
MMASRRKTLSHEACVTCECRTLDTPAILVEVPLPGASEHILSARCAVLGGGTGRQRSSRANSSGCRPRHPTHATNSLSTRKLSLHLLPGLPHREAGQPLSDTRRLSCRSGLSGSQQRRGQKRLGTLRTHTDAVLTRRKRNHTRRATTRRNATHTNATHKLYALDTVSSGGASDQGMRDAGTATEGVRWLRETREQDNAWSHNTTGDAAYNLHSPLPFSLTGVLFAFRRQGQYLPPTCCLLGAAKAKKRPDEISTT